MKRSKVVELIKNHYNCYTSGVDSSKEIQDHADELLYKLEKAGMLPPPYFTKKDLESKKENFDYFEKRLFFGYKGIYEWESEYE